MKDLESRARNLVARGYEAWNALREEEPDWRPDLSGVSLQGADLARFNLNGLDMTRADLRGANLRDADLTNTSLRQGVLAKCNLLRSSMHGTCLIDADLAYCNLGDAALVGANLDCASLRMADFTSARVSGASLVKADLSLALLHRADLTNSDLTDAALNGTDFSDSILRGTKLCGADLRNARFARGDFYGVDMAGATIGWTTFADVDLSLAIGLDETAHHGPSTIGLDTVRRSRGRLSDRFLRAVGLSELVIDYLPSFMTEPIQFYSCFISYSTKDHDFAVRLYKGLDAAGVRCYFAPHNVKGGRKLREQIGAAIQSYQRVLLVLSDNSMASEWVNTEIADARQREVIEKRRVLFPISVVPYDKIKAWECFDADVGKDTAREIREYFIPDFTDWHDNQKFKVSLAKLVEDLSIDPADKPA